MKIERSCFIQTPIGTLLATEENGALTELLFTGGDSDTPETTVPDSPVFHALCNWLDDYFAGSEPTENIPICPRGTAFQLEIWEMLSSIPYGEVVTYGELAAEYVRRHGGRMSAQAIGGAVGSNPISILIPCHRVIGANGCLTGYAAGLSKKLHLLEIEGADTSKMFLPSSKAGRARR